MLLFFTCWTCCETPCREISSPGLKERKTESPEESLHRSPQAGHKYTLMNTPVCGAKKKKRKLRISGDFVFHSCVNELTKHHFAFILHISHCWIIKSRHHLCRLWHNVSDCVEKSLSILPSPSSQRSAGSTPGRRCRSWLASPPAGSARSLHRSSHWRPEGLARCGATWCRTAAPPGWWHLWAKWTVWESGPGSRWCSEKRGGVQKENNNTERRRVKGNSTCGAVF